MAEWIAAVVAVVVATVERELRELDSSDVLGGAKALASSVTPKLNSRRGNVLIPYVKKGNRYQQYIRLAIP